MALAGFVRVMPLAAENLPLATLLVTRRRVYLGGIRVLHYQGLDFQTSPPHGQPPHSSRKCNRATKSRLVFVLQRVVAKKPLNHLGKPGGGGSLTVLDR